MSKTITAGIIGAAGYTGGELIRLLLLHPGVEISFAASRSHAGKPVTSVHTDLLGETDLHFTDKPAKADVLFLCLAHGESKKWLEENPFSGKIIDLSQDFRMAGDHGFVYGLPELNREFIKRGYKIANPGCFATAIQLALLPLAKNSMLEKEVHVSAVTGSTGAGQSLSATSHFTWRYGNHSAYKTLDHQHLAEIGQSVRSLQENFGHSIHFIPSRGAFTRGIHAVVHTETSMDNEEAQLLFRDYYASHPFVHLSENAPDVKQVVNTNKCVLHSEIKNGRIIITSVIDNLLKGASGQAVQNMNLIAGFGETTGLKLKPSAY